MLLQHHRQIRNSSVICCLDGLHFNLLLLLARAGLIKTQGKVIRRHAFRDRALKRLAPLLSNAPPAFGIDYITQDQVARGRAIVGEGRVHLLPWKIDTDWYYPGAAPSDVKGTLFMPGNAQRHDALVLPLLAAGHHVTRAGRPGRLEAIFEGQSLNEGFSLMINRPHPEYLHALQSARAVVLPILPCDEPAGLTAAMEAIACGIPLLTNRSMSLTELLTECAYPIDLLENLEPATWLTAVERLAQQRRDPSFQAALTRSRKRFLDHRSMKPGAADWHEHLSRLSSSHTTLV